MAHSALPIGRYWQAWQELSWGDRGRFCQAWALLIALLLMLPLMKFQQVYGLACRCRKHPLSEDAMPCARRTAFLVNAASAVNSLRLTCLHRSLVLLYLLGRQGITGTLRIGVRKENTGIAAHAWIEVDGIPVNDSGGIVGHFAAFTDPFLTPVKPTS
jgi:hypothetical protein